MWKKFLRSIGAMFKKDDHPLEQAFPGIHKDYNKNLAQHFKKIDNYFLDAFTTLDKEVVIEIQSGVFCVVKKSQGIKLRIKDFDCLHIDKSDITQDKNGDKYYLEEWCADSKV